MISYDNSLRERKTYILLFFMNKQVTSKKVKLIAQDLTLWMKVQYKKQSPLLNVTWEKGWHFWTLISC